METCISYSNWVIRIQSFELIPSSGWVPRFTLRWSDDALLSRDRLDKVFPSKDEADEFALKDAMHWIDEHAQVAETTIAPSATV